MSARNPMLAYRSGFESTISKPRIVQMLLDGAVAAIQKAIDAFEMEDFARRLETIHNQATKAGAIVHQLRDALDPTFGSEFTDRLGALYDYIGNRLIQANIRKDPQLFAEAKSHLEVIQSAWREMMQSNGSMSLAHSQIAGKTLAASPAEAGINVQV